MVQATKHSCLYKNQLPLKKSHFYKNKTSSQKRPDQSSKQKKISKKSKKELKSSKYFLYFFLWSFSLYKRVCQAPAFTLPLFF